MSPETNFGPRVGWSLPWILVGGGAGVVLLLAAQWGMVADTRATRASVDRLQGRLEELRERVDSATATSREIPDPQRISRLRERIGEMESMLSLRGPSFLEVLGLLEKRTPEGVVLENLRQVRERGQVRIKARAGGFPQVTAFLGRLEEVPEFRQVRLIRQSRRPEEGGVVAEIRISGGGG